MAENKDDELEHLRSLLARAHEKREPPARRVIRRMVALLGARTGKKERVERIETKKNKTRKNKDAA